MSAKRPAREQPDPEPKSATTTASDPCPQCSGRKVISFGGHDFECATCGGTGVIDGQNP